MTAQGSRSELIHPVVNRSKRGYVSLWFKKNIRNQSWTIDKEPDIHLTGPSAGYKASPENRLGPIYIFNKNNESTLYT